jgi:hypothetical protein
MRNFLRFLFSGNDVQKIILPLQVDDVIPQAAPPVGSPAPGSMRLRFRQSDPGPAQIRPLFPGAMRFIVDPTAPGVLPVAADVEFTSAAYAKWQTLGRLLISIEDGRLSDEISLLVPDLPVKPNRIWYGPVRIPEEFLFSTLRSNFTKAQLRSAEGRTIRPKNPNGTDNPEWDKHAVAEFLAGHYTPSLRLGGNATQDDVARFVMPTVEVPTDGNIELLVTAALAKKPQDGPDTDENWLATLFDDPANPISRDEPLHPRNGLIPAREVYRHLRASMVEEAASESLRDAILAQWPKAPRFFAIQFTRTWERCPNCSTHFTRHTARVLDDATVLMEQKLPAHGVLFLRQATANPQPAPPNIQVSLAGGDMTWLLGGEGSWRDKGGTVPVGIDLAIVAQPHVAVRLPMSKAIFADTTRPRPGGASCTYFTFRRALRALVDNRIAGGRLNFGVNFTSAETRGIIQRAFAGTSASANLVANNAPNPRGDPELALTLLPVLSAFFPDDADQQSFATPPPTPKILDQGEMAYRLWQSFTDSFEANSTKRNFSDDHIGRGAPGAIVAVELGLFHVDPLRNAGETDAAYFDRVVGLILARLSPGALLQFWNLNSDYESIKARPASGALINSYGHSLTFVDYSRDGAGNITGIRIIDQFGESDELLNGAAGNRRLTWNGNEQEIWIAANWDE